MTPDQQRIAIAEACRWRIVHKTKYAWVVICPSNIERAWSRRNGVINDNPASHYLPNYLGDRNAMHEAIITKFVTIEMQQKFAHQLRTLVKKAQPYASRNWSDWDLITASPSQLSEVFLRTLGRWQETPSQPQ